LPGREPIAPAYAAIAGMPGSKPSAASTHFATSRTRRSLR